MELGQQVVGKRIAIRVDDEVAHRDHKEERQRLPVREHVSRPVEVRLDRIPEARKLWYAHHGPATSRRATAVATRNLSAARRAIRTAASASASATTTALCRVRAATPTSAPTATPYRPPQPARAPRANTENGSGDHERERQLRMEDHAFPQDDRKHRGHSGREQGQVASARHRLTGEGA